MVAWEKLTEVHIGDAQVEWRSKKRPGARVHQTDGRRLGELVQIDGSPHA